MHADANAVIPYTGAMNIGKKCAYHTATNGEHTMCAVHKQLPIP